jgi:hypothetical protein
MSEYKDPRTGVTFTRVTPAQKVEAEKPKTEQSHQPRKSQESEGPRNYANPEPLNTSHIGKTVVVTMVNGRSETGRLLSLGAYMLSIELSTKKELIINKGAIITVSVM